MTFLRRDFTEVLVEYFRSWLILEKGKTGNMDVKCL